jgi:hypothetical protein
MNLSQSFLDVGSKPLVSKKILFTPQYPPFYTASFTSVGDSYQFVTDTNGVITASLVAGTYAVSIVTPTPATNFYLIATETGSYIYSGSIQTGSAQCVTFDLINLVKDPFSVKKVSLTPQRSYPFTFSGSIITLATTSSYTDGTGLVTFNGMVPGPYLAEMFGKIDTSVYISIPAWDSFGQSFSPCWNVKDIIIVKPTKAIPVKLTNLDNSYVLTVSSSDARYASIAISGSLTAVSASHATYAVTATSASWASQSLSASTLYNSIASVDMNGDAIFNSITTGQIGGYKLFYVDAVGNLTASGNGAFGTLKVGPLPGGTYALTVDSIGNMIATSVTASLKGSASYALTSSYAKKSTTADVALNVPTTDLTSVDESANILMWESPNIFGTDGALQYNPSTNIMTVTSSCATTASSLWGQAVSVDGITGNIGTNGGIGVGLGGGIQLYADGHATFCHGYVNMTNGYITASGMLSWGDITATRFLGTASFADTASVSNAELGKIGAVSNVHITPTRMQVTSLIEGTSSWAESASWAPATPSSTAISSSWASASISASYALNGGGNSESASWASASISASYALNGGSGGENSVSASWVSASVYIINADTASYVASASYYPAQTVQVTVDSASWVSASAFITAAQTASYVATASYYPAQVIQTTVESASWVSASVKITTADTASYVASSNVVGTVTSASYTVSASYAPQVTQTTVESASWASSSISSQQTFSGSGYIPISGSILFDTASITYIPVQQEGLVFWDSDDHTLGVGLSKDVTLQVGEETLLRVCAKEYIPNGGVIYSTTESYVNLTNSTHRQIVGLAIADGTSLRSTICGVATEEIPSGSVGFACLIGDIHGMDTSTLTQGAVAYLSTTASGSLTTTRPTPPYEQVYVGVCTYKDATNGIITVNIANPPFTSFISNAGMTNLPTISSSVGNLFVSSGGTVNLYNNSSGSDTVKNYFLSAYTGSIPNTGSTYYLVADYGTGVPTYNVLSSTDTINNTTITNVATIIRPIYRPNGMEYIFHDQFGYALANKLNQRFIRTERFAHETGLTLAESASRVVTISAGAVWFGGSRITTNPVNGAINTHRLFRTWPASSTGWTSSVVTQYNNNEYDNGAGALVTLSGAGTQYAVNFIFKSLAVGDDDLYSVLGRGNYSLAQAQASTVPSPLPAMLSPSAGLSVLVGRIIVAQAASTAYSIESAWTTTFQASAGTDHNALSNLQGGTAGEYYHLTADQSSSINQTASLALTASFVTASNVYGVFPVSQAPIAYSASWVSASAKITTADTASYVQAANIAGILTAAQAPNALSSTQSIYATQSLYANVATQSLNSTQSIYATSSIYANVATQSLNATQSLYATQSINAASASWVSASVKITTADTASYITASNVVGIVTSAISADFALLAGVAISASYAPSNTITNVLSASWVSASNKITTADTASFVTASNVIGILTSAQAPSSLTSVQASNATQSIWATSSIYANVATQSLNATQSIYATQSINAYSASWVSASAKITTADTASYVLQAVSASYATNGGTGGATLTTGSTYPITASWAVTANTASYVVTANTASYVVTANTASYVAVAASANTASYVLNAVSASYAPSTATSTLSNRIVWDTTIPSLRMGQMTSMTQSSYQIAGGFIDDYIDTGSLNTTGSLLYTASNAGYLYSTGSTTTSGTSVVATSLLSFDTNPPVDNSGNGRSVNMRSGGGTIDLANGKFAGAVSCSCNAAHSLPAIYVYDTGSSFDIPTNGSFTIEFFVRVYQNLVAGNMINIFATRDAPHQAGGFMFGLFDNGANGCYFIYNSGLNLTQAVSVITNDYNYHHVACVRSSSNHICIYYDGVPKMELVYSGAFGFNGGYDLAGFSNGQGGSWDQYGLLGNIDNFRYLNGTCSYNGAFTPSSSAFPNGGLTTTITPPNFASPVISQYRVLPFTASSVYATVPMGIAAGSASNLTFTVTLNSGSTYNTMSMTSEATFNQSGANVYCGKVDLTGANTGSVLGYKIAATTGSFSPLIYGVGILAT